MNNTKHAENSFLTRHGVVEYVTECPVPWHSFEFYHRSVFSSSEGVMLRLRYVTIALCYDCVMLRLRYVTIALCYDCVMLRLRYVTIASCYDCVMLRLRYVTIALCYDCVMLRLRYVTIASSSVYYWRKVFISSMVRVDVAAWIWQVPYTQIRYRYCNKLQTLWIKFCTVLPRLSQHLWAERFYTLFW